MINIILLGLTSMLTDISSEMIYPLIPIYLTLQLGATPAIVGIIEGFAESIASLLKVFSGYISDKLQKRKFIAISGYGCSTVGKLFLYISTSWIYVLIARLIDRFGKGIRTAPRDALIADSVGPENRGVAYGIHRTLDTFGAIIGVIIAYILLLSLTNSSHSEQYKNIFLISIIPAILGIIILFFVKEKTGKANNDKFSISELKKQIIIPQKLKYFLIISFFFTLGNSSNQFLLLRAQNLGFNPINVVLLYLVYNITYTLFSYPAGKISDKINKKYIIVLGYLIYGIVYLGFAVIKKNGILWILFGIYGLYMGLTEGVEKALVSIISPKESRATLLGLHSAIVGIGLLPASIIAGALWNIFGPSVPFYISAATGIISSIAFFILL